MTHRRTATDRWTRLSEWHNAWLAADAQERLRLRTRLAAEHPDLCPRRTSSSPPARVAASSKRRPLSWPRRNWRSQPLLAKDAMLGPYRIVGLIARGGMGDVYRATDIRLRRDVALKVLATEHAARTSAGRALRPGSAGHRVSRSPEHRPTLRRRTCSMRPYFVAELLDGETLRARMDVARCHRRGSADRRRLARGSSPRMRPDRCIAI